MFSRPMYVAPQRESDFGLFRGLVFVAALSVTFSYSVGLNSGPAGQVTEGRGRAGITCTGLVASALGTRW